MKPPQKTSEGPTSIIAPTHHIKKSNQPCITYEGAYCGDIPRGTLICAPSFKNYQVKFQQVRPAKTQTSKIKIGAIKEVVLEAQPHVIPEVEQLPTLVP